MAEQFLTLLAELDDDSQKLMAGWYRELQAAGFTGVQTPDLPFHISIATFSLDQEKEAVREVQRLGETFSAIPVQISHIGLFAGGRVLFGAPDRTPELTALRDAVGIDKTDMFPWTPHVTILIDEPEVVSDALRTWIRSFTPFSTRITGLRLCAFWPTREVTRVLLPE